MKSYHTLSRDITVLLLFSALILAIPATGVSTGSCAKISIDGLTCQQCVSNYHLSEGECYVDILGCARYTFGNICRQCQNGYILVNNLCCDERCMAQIFRIQNQEVSKKDIATTISNHFETLSVIIPQLQQNYVKGSLSNLVEIDYESFLDVDRYVFLFQFYSGGFSRKRAVVDFVKGSAPNKTNKKQIIEVDWKTLGDNQQFLSFPKQELPKKNYEKIIDDFDGIYTRDSQQDIVLIKRYQFSNVNEFQIVSQNLQSGKTTVKTLYKQKGKILTLINKEQSTPKFEPYEFKYEGEQNIRSKAKKSEALRKVLQTVQKDPKYHPELKILVQRANSRQVTHFVIYVENQKESIEFYIDHLSKENQCKIIDIKTKQKIGVKVPQVSVVPEKQITKIDKIPEQIIDDIKKDLIQKDQSECQGDENENNRLIKFVRKSYNLSEDAKIIQVFRRKFETFVEITILIKTQKKYQYFFIQETELSNQLIYLGVEQKQKPTIENDKYAVCNSQQQLTPKDLKTKTDIVNAINTQYPETLEKPIILVRQRVFPNKKRYIIVFRFPTEKRRYIIQEKETEISVLQWKVTQSNLEEVKDSKPEEIYQVIEEVIDQIQQQSKQECVDGENHGENAQERQKQELNFLRVVRQKYSQLENSQQIKVLRHWTTKFRLVREFTLLISYESQGAIKYGYFYFSRDSRGLHFHGKEDTASPKVNKNGEYRISNPQKRIASKQSASAIEKINKDHPITASQSTRISQVLMRQFPDHIRFLIKMVTSQNESEYWVNEYINQQVQERVIIIDFVEKHKHNKNDEKKIDLENQAPQICQGVRQELSNDQESQVIEDNTPKQKILNFIREKNEGISSSFKIEISLVNKINEKTVLLEQDNQKKVCYIKQTNQNAEYFGCQNVKEFIKNPETQRYIIPNPQNKKQAKQYKSVIEKIYESNSQYEGMPITNIQQRVFPLITRVTIFIRLEYTIIRFVIHIQNEDKSIIKIISKETVKENLPKLTESQKENLKLKEQVEIQILKEKKEQEKSNNVNIVSQESKQTKQKQQKNQQQKVIEFIRSQKGDLGSFQIVKVFRKRSFKTYREDTVLIKLENSKFWYFYLALQHNESNNFTLLGFEEKQQAYKNEFGQLQSPRPQQLSKEKEVSDFIEFINQKNTETKQLPIQKILKRNFGQTIRVLIIYRYEKMTVEYVLWKTVATNEIRLIQSEPYQIELPKLDDKIAQDIQNQKNLELQIANKVLQDTRNEQRKQKLKKIEEELNKLINDQIPRVNTQEIKKQIVKKVHEKIYKVIEQNEPSLTDYEVITVWKRRFETFEEETCIIKKDNEYRKVYFVTRGDENHSYEYLGNQIVGQAEIVKQEQQEKQVQVEPIEKYTKFLNQQKPETQGHKIVKNIIRKFPRITRVKIIVRFDTKRVVYILKQDKQEKIQIIQEKLLETDLKPLPKQEKPTVEIKEDEKIIRIVEEVLEKTQTKKEEKQLITDADKYTEEISKINQFRQQTLNYIFSQESQKGMTSENTKLVGFWVRDDFETYKQIVLLVRIQDQLSYFYVFFKIENKEFSLLGRKDVEQSKLDQKGLIIPDNYQENIKFEQNLRVIERISQQYPQTVKKTINQMTRRQFPGVTRFLVSIRLETSIVRYIVHDINGSLRIIETKVIKDSLPRLTIQQIAKQQIVRKIVEDLEQDKKEENVRQNGKGQCNQQQDGKEAVVCTNNQSNRNQITAPKLINLIKQNDKTLAQYEILRVFHRNFDTFKQITVLLKTGESSYRYYYIKKELQSGQLIYLGVEHKTKVTVRNEKYTLCNGDKKLVKQDPQYNYQQIIRSLNQKRPQTNNRPIILSRVRQFPEHRRYVFVIRLSTEKRRYVLEQNSKGIRIIQEKVTQKDLPTKEATAEQKQVEEQIVDLIEQIAKENSQESQTQGCEGDNEEKQVIQKEEQETVKLIRKHNPSLQEFSILKRWKNNHIRMFREITILIKSGDNFYYVFFMETRKDKLIQYAGTKRIIEPQVNQNAKYVLPNPQKRVQKKAAQKAIQVIQQQHPLSKQQGSVVKRVVMRVFPTHRRYIIIFTSKKLLMKFIIIQKKNSRPEIVDFEENQSEKTMRQKVDTDKEDILYQISVCESEDNAVSICGNEIDVQKTEQNIEKDKSERQILTTKILTNIKQSNKAVSENSKIQKFWIQSMQSYEKITVLIKDGQKFMYYYIIIKKSDNIVVQWGRQSVQTPFKNVENSQYILPNPIERLARKQYPEKVITLLNEKARQTNQKRVNNIWKQSFPQVREYKIRVRIQTEIVEYIIQQNTKNGELSLIGDERKVIKENLKPLTVHQIQIYGDADIIKNEIVNENKEQLIANEGIENRQQKPQENDKTQQQLIKIVRENNKDIENLVLVEIWRRQSFVKSKQITLLMQSGTQYFYFFIRKHIETNQYVYLGKEETTDPKKDKEGVLTLPNPQKNIQKEVVATYIEQIHRANPETKDQTIVKILERKFPDGSERVVVRYREETKIVQYVILKNQNKIWIDEIQDFRTDLKQTNEQEKKMAEKIQQIEADVDHPENKNKSETNIQIYLVGGNLKSIEEQQSIQVKNKLAEKWRQIKQKQSLCDGVKTVLIQQLDESASNYYNYALTHLKGTPEQIRQQKTPVKVFRNTFCNYEQTILVFRYQPSALTYFMFIQKLDTQNKQFMGLSTIQVDPSLENSEILDITDIKTDLNSERVQQAVQLATNKYRRISGRELREFRVRKFPTQQRYSLLFRDQNSKEQKIDDRFLVLFRNDGSEGIVEECRIKEKQVSLLKKQQKVDKQIKVQVEQQLIKYKPQIAVCETSQIVQCALQVINVKNGTKNIEDVVKEHTRQVITQKELTSQQKQIIEQQNKVKTIDTQISIEEDMKKEVLDKVKQLQEKYNEQTKKLNQEREQQKQKIHQKIKELEQKSKQATQESKQKIQEAKQQLKQKKEELQRGLKIKQEEQRKHVGEVNQKIVTKSNEQQVNIIIKQKEVSPEIAAYNSFLAEISPQSASQKTVGIQEEISKFGKTILISKKRTDIQSVDQYFIYKTQDKFFYLGKKNIDTQSFNPSISNLLGEKQLTGNSAQKQQIYGQTIKFVKKSNGEDFKAQEIKRSTYVKYASGMKWTCHFQFKLQQSYKYAAAYILRDQKGNLVLLDYEEKSGEPVKNHLTIEQQSKQKEQSCPLQSVLNEITTKITHISGDILAKQVRTQLPNSVQYELEFQNREADKQTSILISCIENGNKERTIQIINYLQQQLTNKSNSVETVVKEIEKEEVMNYQPVDPNVVYYPAAAKLLQSIPKGELDEQISLDKMPEELQDVIYYLRIRYEIVRISSVIKIVKDSSSSISTKQSYKIYFFLAPSEEHPAYRTYEAQINYSKEAGQQKIKVNNFRLVIDQNKIVQKIADQSDQDDVDIAYGYKTMDIVEVKHNRDLKVIMRQIKSRYGEVLKGNDGRAVDTEVISVQFLELKDGRVNYKITVGNENKQKFKFVIFYQPSIERVLVLNSVTNNYQSQQAKQLSNQEQTKDITLQKIVQTYLTQLHKEDIGQQKVKVACVGVIQNLENGRDYHINILNQNTGKKYRSTVRVQGQNEDFKQISWTEVVEISLDHYRLDESEKVFIMNYQKLTQQDMQNNGYFKLIYNYAKHQNADLSEASLLGAAFKPSNIGFKYQIFGRQSNGNLLNAEVYIESFSQKINLIKVESMSFVEGFSTLKTEDKQTNKIAKALRKKINLEQLNEERGDYLVKSAEAKSFLYGNLYKMQIEVSLPQSMGGNRVLFQGLLYHDHSTEQLHLIYWKEVQATNVGKCQQTDEKSGACLRCQNSAPAVNEKCTLGVQNCEYYDGLNCATCREGFLMVNGVCSNDCGPLCDIVVLR